MNKAVFVIATQYDNLGDLIINKCLIDELSNHSTLYIDSENVSENFKTIIFRNEQLKPLAESHNLSFKDSRILKLLFNSSIRFNFFFRSPGPINSGKPPFKTRLKIMVYGLILSAIKSKIGKSYIIGSEVNIKSKKQLEQFKRNSDFYSGIFLRGKNNIKTLKNEGIPNLQYIPDLCFLMQDSINNKSNIGRKKIGISFRDLNNSELAKKISDSVHIAVDYFTSLGYEIVFFYQVDRDFEYTKNLFLKFIKQDNVTFIEESLNYDQIDIYNEFELVISNRLHVLLLGFVHNALAIPVVDNHLKTNKILDIFDSIDSTIKPFDVLIESDLKDIYDLLDFHKIQIEAINKKQKQLCKEIIAGLFV